MNSAPVEATFETRLFGAISYLILSTNGVFWNVLLARILIKSHKIKENAFYSITCNLIACDLLSHFINFTVAIPIILLGFDIYGGNLFIRLMCFFHTFSYMGTLFFSLILTINRFTVFILPRLNQFLFRSQIIFTLGFWWIGVTTYVTLSQLTACGKIFNAQALIFELQFVPPNLVTPLGAFIQHLTSFFVTYFPKIMFISYILIILYIKFKLSFRIQNGKIIRRQLTTSNETNNRELSLLIQSFIICGFFEVEKAAFTFLPYISAEGQWIFILRFVGSWATLILNSIHPIVLFTFNRDIKNQLKQLYHSSFGRISSMNRISVAISHVTH